MTDQHNSPVNNENKESTTLLWFDPNIEVWQDAEVTKQRLRLINDFVIFHTDLEQCIAFIQSISTEKLFLITSGKQASQLLPRVAHLRQLDSIFIFCLKINRYQHLTSEYLKIVGIYSRLDDLCQSIQQQIDLVDKQLQTFSLFDQHQRATKDLSKQSAEFLWFQLFNHVILRLPRNQHAKQQMIDICRCYYQGNTKEQKLIDEFERDYRSEDAIRWYSKQSFVYKLVNKALRSEDIDQLHRFRFFIGDLSRNLVGEHDKMLSSKEKVLTVYRGAKLDREEFDKLKANEGKLISTNGYLSTSRLRSFALGFAMKKASRTDIIRVLFEIECIIEEIGNSVTFGDIAQFSDYPDEKEVLFDLNAAFLLKSIEEDKEYGIYIIRMNVTNEGENIFKDYMKETNREAEEKSVSIVFGRLLCSIGECDKSQKYFEELLKEPNGEDIAWIEYNIGRALYLKDEWRAARTYYEHAYQRMVKAEPPRTLDSAYVLNSLGLIFHRLEVYNDAISYYDQALQIRRQYYPSDHVNIATSLINIGMVFQQQEDYNKALDYYQQALVIQERCYPSGHVDIARSLNNIGTIFCLQSMLEKAFEYHQRALQMRERFYPSGHISIIESLKRISTIVEEQKKLDEMYYYNQRILEIQKQYYPADHIDITKSLQSIGTVFEKQGRYDEALEYYREAMHIQEKYSIYGHTDIVKSLKSIGAILEKQKCYNEALVHYRQLLQIQKKDSACNYHSMAQTLRIIGVILEKQKCYDEALASYVEALHIQENHSKDDYTNIAENLKSIAAIYEKQRKYKEALIYYQNLLTLQNSYFSIGQVDTIHIMTKIAIIYYYEKEYEEARLYFEAVLSTQQTYQYSDYDSISQTYSYMGHIFYQQKEYTAAHHHYQQALKIREELYPNGHETIGDSLSDIATYYKNTNNSKMALNYFKRALTIYERFLPVEHPSRIKIENNIKEIKDACILM